MGVSQLCVPVYCQNKALRHPTTQNGTQQKGIDTEFGLDTHNIEQTYSTIIIYKHKLMHSINAYRNLWELTNIVVH